jgi:hypothetical protein
MKRSGFLLGSDRGLSVVVHRQILLARVRADAAARTAGGSDRVLVVINFQGGNDGLNTVVPYGIADYYKFRPSLGSRRRRAAHRRHGRPQSRAGAAQEDVRRRQRRDRARRRLSRSRPLALPLDRDLADGRAENVRDDRLARTVPRRRRPAEGQPVQRGRAQQRAARSARRENVRRPGDRRAARVRSAERSQRHRPRRVPRIRARHDGAVPLAVSSRRSPRSKITRSAARKNCPNSSPATRRKRPIPRRRSAAAWRSPRRSSARSSARACSTSSTARSTRHVTQKATQDRLLADFANAISAFYTDLAAHGNDGA